MDNGKKEQRVSLAAVKDHVDAAFAALCQIQVSGPAAIPYARAVQELAAAGVELKGIKAQPETRKRAEETGGDEP